MIYKYRKIVERRKGRRDSVLQDLKASKKNLRALKRELKSSEEASVVIQTVAKKTQDQLEYNLSNLVSIAMASILPDPYELKLYFSLRRGRVETDLKFIRRGMEIDPVRGSAGGAVDIAALSMRPSIHVLTRPRPRNSLLLDEPLVALKGSDMPKRGSELIKEMSRNIKMQVIMVSHSDELIGSADRIFNIAMKNGESTTKKE